MKIPTSKPAIIIRLLRGLAHQLSEHDPTHHRRPELNVATQDARWFLLCQVDGVTAAMHEAALDAGRSIKRKDIPPRNNRRRRQTLLAPVAQANWHRPPQLGCSGKIKMGCIMAGRSALLPPIGISDRTLQGQFWRVNGQAGRRLAVQPHNFGARIKPLAL